MANKINPLGKRKRKAKAEKKPVKAKLSLQRKKYNAKRAKKVEAIPVKI
jgi:hypothetical protein